MLESVQWRTPADTPPSLPPSTLKGRSNELLCSTVFIPDPQILPLNLVTISFCLKFANNTRELLYRKFYIQFYNLNEYIHYK